MIDPIDTIIHGDCLEVMATMPDEYVDLVVTSPPYDDLRSYHGYTLDVPAMIDQLWRIMKQGGVIVWVVGDATVNGSETGTSFRQALMFMDAGFNLHDTMIFAKDGPSYPEINRYYNIFEYMLIFSKGTPRVINLIKDRKNKRYGKSIRGTITNPDGSSRRNMQKSYYISAEHGVRFNIWRYGCGNMKSNRDGLSFIHPAPFPEKLAADHIISWSNEGDLVFDPMCGSGTTCKMAERLDRHWIGCDASKEYVDIANERIRIERAQLKFDLTPEVTSNVEAHAI